MCSGLRLSAPCRSKEGEEISGLLLPRRGSACSPMAVKSVLVLTSSCWGINTNYQTVRYFMTVNEPPTVVFTCVYHHRCSWVTCNPYCNPFFLVEICLLPHAMLHENSPERSPWSSLQRLLSNTRATEERLDKLLGDEVRDFSWRGFSHWQMNGDQIHKTENYTQDYSLDYRLDMARL